MTRTLRPLAGVLVAAAIAVSPARAAFINGAISNPSVMINFNELGQINSGVTNEFAAYGVTFSPGLGFFYEPNPNLFITNGASGSHLNGGFRGGVYSIHFTAPRSGASFSMGTGLSPAWVFSAYYQGALVESGTVFPNPNGFYGFQDIVLDEIRFNARTGFVLDYLWHRDALAPVPAPPGVVLFAVGLAGLGGFRLLRRKTQAVVAA
jgi:hypothetical protein